MAAYKAKKILFYTVRVILNLVNHKRNIFHKKYIQHSLITKQFIEKGEFDKGRSDSRLVEFKVNLNKRINICEPCEGIEVRRMIEDKEVKVLNELNNLDKSFGTFYYRMLTELVKKSGSMREASRRTGIPVCTISRGIAVVRKHLKKRFND